MYTNHWKEYTNISQYIKHRHCYMNKQYAKGVKKKKKKRGITLDSSKNAESHINLTVQFGWAEDNVFIVQITKAKESEKMFSWRAMCQFNRPPNRHAHS